MNSEIFREYDIRGVADRDLTDPVANQLGRGVGALLLDKGGKRLVLGRDCRLSSDRIHASFSAGLLDVGIDVVDIGVAPTPVLYYALFNLQVDGGVMITGSHNPGDYNGLKISMGRESIHGAEIQSLRRRVESGRFPSGRGRLEVVDVRDRYLALLEDSFGALRRRLKVVVDCGNGAASNVAPEVYRRMGCEVVELFCEMDGRFPNHHPDPTVLENLADLRRVVAERKADLGVAFDGDGDRLGVIAEDGAVVWGDQLMILYSRQVLERHPGATIIGEVKCSMNLFREIERRGGKALMWKAGHSLIKSKMKETGALLAGEMSGHIFFADRYAGYDDATYAGARLLEIVAESDGPVSRLFAGIPKTYTTPELRVDTPEKDKFELVRRAAESLSERFDTISIDGVRVVFEDGWGLIRASNTQPALVLRFEASTPERLKEIRSLIESELANLKQSLRA